MRKKLIILATATLALVAFGWILTGPMVTLLGGDFEGPPDALHKGPSEGAKKLIDDAYRGIDRERLFDYHTHVAGIGTGGSGAWVNDEMVSWSSPVKRAKFDIYLSASGVSDLADADAQFVARLTELVKSNPRHGKHAIMAFDRRHRDDGSPWDEHTEFYVPNGYVFALAAAEPEIFEPVMSIHPYRDDAVERLRHWAGEGGRYVKWLPNAMGIDPADERCDPFYEAMAELDLVLISHTGEEQAVDAAKDQERGNPLRLRRPMEHGVKVVAAHAASLGESKDLDAEGEPLTPNFELFMRMMENPRWNGLLFADISAMTQWNRAGEPLATLLRRGDLHDRLVNGSDYPLPAINALVSTWELVRQGFLTEEERTHLNEIYEYDPLLFDFVTKRTLRAPGSGEKFAPRVFMRHPEL